MRYSVCVIDNDIPASGTEAQALGINDSSLLNASNLQLLLRRATWQDAVIKNLIGTLLSETEQDGISPKWDVYGFAHPSFYINSINDSFFRSDVVVLDWEYPGTQTAESILREIIERTFCLVFVFSKADKKDEIEAILAKQEFQPYKERLFYLDKAVAGIDQTGTLLQKSDEMYAQNFSFKFAGVLRRRSVQCADRILSDMGRASLNDVKNLIFLGEGGKRDFIDFLAERFRSSIADPQISAVVDEIPEGATAVVTDTAMIEKVWSCRLYFHEDAGDDLVRRGDIVEVGGDTLLVLSADCDLGHFWHKNLGAINAIPLHQLDQSGTALKTLLEMCVKLKPNGPQSLLGKVGLEHPEGPFLLPYVPKGDGFANYVAIPKNFVSRPIPTPPNWERLAEKEKKKHPVKYSYWQGAKRLCTVSEPFLTPIVQHVFAALGGFGVPDYPPAMSAALKEALQEFRGAAPPAPPPGTSPAKETTRAARLPETLTQGEAPAEALVPAQPKSAPPDVMQEPVVTPQSTPSGPTAQTSGGEATPTAADPARLESLA